MRILSIMLLGTLLWSSTVNAETICQWGPSPDGSYIVPPQDNPDQGCNGCTPDCQWGGKNSSSNNINIKFLDVGKECDDPASNNDGNFIKVTGTYEWSADCKVNVDGDDGICATWKADGTNFYFTANIDVKPIAIQCTDLSDWYDNPPIR